ncbi:MAG: c-type cytochrome [Planctomycetota bacterium]|jgi:putative heme-binding domain-containing protein
MIRCLTACLVLCLAASHVTANAADSVQWSFTDDTAGWTPVTDVKLEAKDGHLIVIGTNRDPHFMADVKATGGQKLLKIRAKFKGRLQGQVFWAEQGKDGFSEQRSARYETRGNGEYRNIHIYFHADADVTQLRIDPHSGECRLEIASIELVNEAPPEPQSTPADQIRLAKGFKAELLYSVPQVQGSWVSLCVDPKGRLITSDQYGKLYRITVPEVGSDATTNVEEIPVELGMAQGLCWAFDSLYVMVNGKGAGLYRVRDTNGDDQLDDVKLLRALSGGGEHGPHAVVLSPDGKSLYICGGNHTDIPGPETSRLPRTWDEDQLLPRMWDAGGHAVGKLAPGGWVAKTDPEGKSFELIAAGFRNEYDLAFNAQGELFTYDADMEWDVGTPWYRPTRVNHVVSGAEFGWRSGTGKWPDYYPDSLGAVVNIGPGSPTGITFGTGARFPAKYQNALFICDWSYSVLYAVHMEPDGATYTGTAERFASGVPLQLTDIVIRPQDGAMYLTIGGRRTQSGLYRVTYTGDEPTTPAAVAPVTEAMNLRRGLEALHEAGHEDQLRLISAGLSHGDRNVRYAARIALEHIPMKQWPKLRELHPDARSTLALAAARSVSQIPEDIRPEGLTRTLEILADARWNELSENQQLDLLRAYSLLVIRFGEPTNDARKTLVETLNDKYPAPSTRLNRELSQLLIYLNAPDVVPRTLDLLEQAPTQEEQLQLALWLRSATAGWSIKDRQRYFAWFNKAARHRGGHSFGGFLKNIRNEAIASLNDDEKTQLADILAAEPQPEAEVIEPRAVIKKWTVAELLPLVQTKLSNRDFERGRRMFSQAACFKCHRFAGQGGIVGPDLTGAGRRFNDLNLLEALVEPSKVVSDQYEATTFLLDSGKAVTGRIVNLNGGRYMVSENMLDPGNLTSINVDEIEETLPSKVSMMPKGLLDTLTQNEILDLVAYLRAGGDPGHDVFKAQAE